MVRIIRVPRGFEQVPVASILLAVLTIGFSMSVAERVNGFPFSDVPVIELASFGGVRISDLRDLELWRLATAQLVHAKWLHMLFNVGCLVIMGSPVERVIGKRQLLFCWFIGGGLATAVSPILIEPPFNVGTGASQAVLSFTGAAIALMATGALPGLWPRVAVLICAVPAFALDFHFAGYPKPGHVTAVLLGIGLGFSLARLRWLRRRKTLGVKAEKSLDREAG